MEGRLICGDAVGNRMQSRNKGWLQKGDAPLGSRSLYQKLCRVTRLLDNGNQFRFHSCASYSTVVQQQKRKLATLRRWQRDPLFDCEMSSRCTNFCLGSMPFFTIVSIQRVLVFVLTLGSQSPSHKSLIYDGSVGIGSN